MKSPELKLNNIYILPHAISLELGDTFTKAHHDHEKARSQLKEDKTRTVAAKEQALAAFGQSQLKTLNKIVKNRINNLTQEVGQQQKKIDSLKQIRSTTDAVILQGAAAVIKDLPLNSILSVIRDHDDIEVARSCVCVASLRLREDLNDILPSIHNEIERITLGPDHEAFQNAKERLQIAEQLDTSMSALYNEFQKTIDHVKSSEWQEPDAA